MSIIITGEIGIPLKEIIKKLGNKSYAYIEFRCKWEEDLKEYDEFFGGCSYDNKTQTLTPLDYDSYSLNDLYEEWEEWQNESNKNCLTVWEHGFIEKKEY